MLAKPGLNHVVLKGDGRGEIGLEHFLDSRERLLLVPLRILFLSPEADGDRFLVLDLREERQDLQKTMLLCHNGQNFVLDRRTWRRSELTYAGLIFHDLRRCAVRGLIRAGVAQKTAMTITGHKTIAVFQRYQIVAPADKQEAVRKLELSQEQEREFLKKSQALDLGRVRA